MRTNFRDRGQDHRRIRRLLRHLDVLADARLRETPGLQMARESEHRHRELELGFCECISAHGVEARELVVLEIEAIGIGHAQPFDRRLGARIDDAALEPQRSEIVVLIEGLDDAALFPVREDPIDLGSQEIAHLFGDRAIGRVERCQRIGRRFRHRHRAVAWRDLAWDSLARRSTAVARGAGHIGGGGRRQDGLLRQRHFGLEQIRLRVRGCKRQNQGQCRSGQDAVKPIAAHSQSPNDSRDPLGPHSVPLQTPDLAL
jgi:hypothetical protein